MFLLIIMRVSLNSASSNVPPDYARRSMFQLNGSSCQIPTFPTPAVHTADIERGNHHLSSPLSSPITIHVSVSKTSDGESISSSASEMLRATEKLVDEDAFRDGDAQQSPRSPHVRVIAIEFTAHYPDVSHLYTAPRTPAPPE